MEDCWVHETKLGLYFEEYLKVFTVQKLAQDIETALISKKE